MKSIRNPVSSHRPLSSPREPGGDTTKAGLRGPGDGGYGYLQFWNEHKQGVNKTDKVYLEDYLNTGKKRESCYSHHPQKREIDEHLDRTFAMTYGDLIGQDGFYNRMVANTHFFVRYQRKVNDVQRRNGFFTAE